MDHPGRINHCPYLYLSELAEPDDNSLRVILHEARSGDALSVADISGPVTAVRPIEHRPGYQVFELNWNSYIAYSVRNESYASRDTNEVFEGELFRTYSQSRYLDFVAASTIASADYPGPFRHWGIICLNHVIDVVSVDEPEIICSVAA